MPSLSSRLSAASGCKILTLAHALKRRKDAGQTIIDFSIGNVRHRPHTSVYAAAVQAVHDDSGLYRPSRGEPALVEAYCDYLRRRGFAHYAGENIAVGMGAKHLIFSALYALLDPGDAIVIPTPCWPTYFDIAALAGAQVVTVRGNPAGAYKVDAAQLRQSLTPRTRALILNSPCNPTGAVYSTAELSAIAEVLTDFDGWIVCDDVYGELGYDDARVPHLLDVAPQLRDRIIKIDSLSKSFAMPGWRIGLMAAPAAVAEAVSLLNSNTISNITEAASAAARRSLVDGDSHLHQLRADYRARKDLVMQRLADAPHLRCSEPAGAFYVFADISAALGRRMNGTPLRSAAEICQALLDSKQVALLPGDLFGDPDGVRLSFATSIDDITEGCERITSFFRALD